MLAVLLLTGLFAQGQQFNSTYQIVDAQKASTIGKEVSAAAAAGFHVVLGSNTKDTAKLFLLEKSESLTDKAEYQIVGESKPAELERRMNAAGAQGFQMAPRSAIRNPGLVHLGGEEIVVLMEKAGGAGAGQYQYHVASVNAEYQARDLLLKTSLTGNLDTASVDEQMTEAVMSGFQFRSLVVRKVEEKKSKGIIKGLGAGRKIKLELIVIFERAADNPQSGVRFTPAEAAKRYHVMTAMGEPKEFETMLNSAAAAGYHVLAVAASGYPEMMAIVGRNESDDDSRSYRVLEVGGAEQFEKDLGIESTRGWAPLPNGLLSAKGEAPLASLRLVIEKRNGAPADAGAEYRVLSAFRIGTLEKELAAAADAGFHVWDAGPAYSEFVIVLKRSPTPESR